MIDRLSYGPIVRLIYEYDCRTTDDRGDFAARIQIHMRVIHMQERIFVIIHSTGTIK